MFSVEPFELEPYKSSEDALLDHVPVMGVLELDKFVWPYRQPFIKQDRGKLENICSCALSFT